MAFKIVLSKLPDDLAAVIIRKQAELKIERNKNVSLEDTVYVLMRELIQKNLSAQE